jgi:hypothetical protein
LPVRPGNGHTTQVIANVIVHLVGEMPILCDLEAMPAGGDRSLRCTNVRTIDGKRPTFVHDRNSTFILPISTIRVIEVPTAADAAGAAPQAGPQVRADATEEEPAEPEDSFDDEEPDEDLLARIRSL